MVAAAVGCARPLPVPSTASVVAEPPCEVSRFGPHPGATRAYVGELALRGQEARGTEILVLRANAAWRERGGADCTVAWHATGTVTVAPSDCDGCTQAVVLHLELDPEGTTCPATYVEHLGGAQDTRYDVWAGDDGAARLTFPSGTLMGEGTVASDRLTYRTYTTCEWY